MQYFQKYFFYLIGDGVPDICINIGYESMANSEMGGRIDNQETSMAIMSTDCRGVVIGLCTSLSLRDLDPTDEANKQINR
jgi:hypothetical protein